MQALNRKSLRDLLGIAAATFIYVAVLPHPWLVLDWAFGLLMAVFAIGALRNLLR